MEPVEGEFWRINFMHRNNNPADPHVCVNIEFKVGGTLEGETSSSYLRGLYRCLHQALLRLDQECDRDHDDNWVFRD